VKSVKSQLSMGGLVKFIGDARKKGVRLWSENGNLHYKAPKGSLTQDEIERFRSSRDQVVAFLERVPGAQTAEPKLEPRSGRDRAPMACQQLAHWNWYQLNERRAIRQIASATRLRGRLNVEALRESITEIVRRHDALRTRIVVVEGTPVQEISQSGGCQVEWDDLTALSESLREVEVKRLIEKHILDPVDVAEAPLLAVRLLRLGAEEHVLIVAMEHMISDAFSLNVLLREIFTAYVQLLKGQGLSLPEIPLQFPDYAVWQRNSLKSWIEKHGAYWNERITGCQRLRFPEDKMPLTTTRLGWGVVPLRIGMDLKKELREWCRLRRTTLVMSIFTAYVALVLRWCDRSEAVVLYQSDGRFNPEMQNTIGYFASALCLRIRILEDDSFVELMDRVTEEYCKAYEHADSSYFASQMPRPEFLRNSAFNWVPAGTEFDIPGLEDAITCAPVDFVDPLSRNLDVDSEPSVLLYDAGESDTSGEVWFPRNRFSADTMERFGRNFLAFIGALLRQPQERVKDIVLL
jgi:hypothetical protein